MTGKMPLKTRLINRDRFDSDRLQVSFETQNAIDHEKRESMRQNAHDLIRLKRTLPKPQRLGRSQGTAFLDLSGDGAGEFPINAVTRFDRDDVAANPLSR